MVSQNDFWRKIKPSDSPLFAKFEIIVVKIVFFNKTFAIFFINVRSL